MCLARVSALKQGPSCVVLTDGDDKALDLLNENLVRNGFQRNGVVVAGKLGWGDTDADSVDRFIGVCRSTVPFRSDTDAAAFDCIVAGDVLYKAELPALFLATVKRLLSPNGTLWLCHVPRATVTHDVVRAAAHENGFVIVDQVERFGNEQMDSEYLQGNRSSCEVSSTNIGNGCPREDLDRAQIYRMMRRSID